MGLMDKFKNLFTDEEIIEEEEIEPIEIKEVKKEEEVHQLPTFMREKIKREEEEKRVKLEQNEKNRENIEIKKELKLEKTIESEDVESLVSKVEKEEKVEEKMGFKFPIELNDTDFVETRSRQSLHQQRSILESPKKDIPDIGREMNVPREKVVKPEQKVAELYKDKKKEVKDEVRKFKATPIISPIYGILDKNYTPMDMEYTEGENFEERRHSKSVDFDSVRKKAYGSLTEEIRENLMCENCEYLKEAKQCKKEKEYQKIPESNLLYDVLEEDDATDRVSGAGIPVCERKDITFGEATENYYDYGVAYEQQNEVVRPMEVESIDSYENVRIVNHEKTVATTPKKEIPPVKSSINLLSTLKKSMGDNVEPKKTEDKNLELTDDLFNLIDSMYDERNDS